MSLPRVFVTRVIPDAGLSMVRSACDAEVWAGDLPPSHEDIVLRIRDCEGLLCMIPDPIDAAVLDAASPRLRVISSYTVGYDNIDVAEATRRGIQVTNTPGSLTEATADFAFALLMAVARRIPEGMAHVRDGLWKTWGPRVLRGRDIHDATLGIVGMGRIGTAMARRARGFAMKVLFFDPGESSESDFPEGASRCDRLEDLLSRADFVSLHVPHTPETHRMIDAEALACMKPTAFLINTARGAVVDTPALLEALEEGRIAGAALDVTEPEPLPPDHPLIALPNCLVVPHLGSASLTARARMSTMAAENLVAALNGARPPHLVNDEVLSR